MLDWPAALVAQTSDSSRAAQGAGWTRMQRVFMRVFSLPELVWNYGHIVILMPIDA